MTARWIIRIGGALFLLVSACAQPVDQLGGTPGPAASTCSNGSCDGCTTCFNMCMCGGSTPSHCASICATGTGGSTSTGGSGGGVSVGGTSSGGTGSSDAGIGGTSFGGTGGTVNNCNVSIGEPNCNTCMQNSCCSVAEACAYDDNCLGLMDCMTQAPECQSAGTLQDLVNCGATACPAQASGKVALEGYLGCLTTTCAPACGM